MNSILSVGGLTKHYKTFSLENVGFSMEAGRIMGFIGRNGAGKTTTLKSILNLVHPDAGEIKYFGLDLREHEAEIKQRIGYAAGGVSWYQMKPIRTLAEVTSTFFPTWDGKAYRRYMEMFSLDEDKKPKELSEGMKVKLALTLALSHRAELLILDEPTSGLDPVSRDDLLTTFRALADEGVAILFSTHITSDLDKCADDITYIRQGRIIASEEKGEFVRSMGGGTLEDIMLRIEKGEVK